MSSILIILGEGCLENTVSGLFTSRTSKYQQQKFIHQMLKNGVIHLFDTA